MSLVPMVGTAALLQGPIESDTPVVPSESVDTRSEVTLDESQNHPAATAPFRSVTLHGARAVLDAALAAATASNLAVCIAIVDHGGEPVLTARMDGAPRLSATIALNKAWTVVSFNGIPTEQWWEMIKDEPPLVHGITHTPRLTIFAGGVPLDADDRLVGAVGVSGGSAAQDAAIAAAGAAAIE